MTFVVTENCIKCKFTDCVDVCPVDCFHEGPNFLVIDPDECIDCTLCEPECPAKAIFSENDLPDGQEIFIQLNAELSKQWPIITEIKSGLPDADQWNGIDDKRRLLGIGISEEELQLGLADPSPEIRIRSVTFSKKFTDSEIDAALNDISESVKIAVITHHRIKLTEAQIERCLTDENSQVRVALLSRAIFALTPIQIERALIDNDINVQLAILQRGDIEFTPEQFHRGLNSKDNNLYKLFIDLLKKQENTLFYQQALTHDDPEKRIDGYINVASLTQEQINRGITDPALSIRIVCAKRPECIITPQILEDALFSCSSELSNACLNKYDGLFTDTHIELGLKSTDYRIRTIFASSNKTKLSALQIIKLLNDKSSTVKAAVAYRDDFEPTPEQLTKGLDDKAYEVREAFTRFVKRANLIKTQLRLQNNPIKVLTEDEIVKLLPAQLLSELKQTNSRLTQRMALKDILFSIGNTARWGEGACVLLQPGNSGYIWSARIIPLIFIVNTAKGIRIRLTRGRSYRNSGATPATWQELRGFPKGKSLDKLKNWATALDGCLISMDLALAMPEGELDCHMNEWLF